MNRSAMTLGAALMLAAWSVQGLPLHIDPNKPELESAPTQGVAETEPATTSEESPAVAPADELLVDVPEDILRDIVDTLREFMSEYETPDPAVLQDLLDREIAQDFDFGYIARWAAGPLYEQMNETQMAAFMRKLRHLYLNALVRDMGAFMQPFPRVDILSPQPGRAPNELIVRMHVLPADGFPQRLDFRFSNGDEGWKIFDVVAKGVSATGYTRAYFGGLVRRGGPQALYK
jgi:phospholipid transport system substrate-binding protein